MSPDLRGRTIADFGDQWATYTDNGGYYGSVALLEDVLGPLLRVDALRGAVGGDIGAGTGRYTNILIRCRATKSVAGGPAPPLRRPGATTAPPRAPREE